MRVRFSEPLLYDEEEGAAEAECFLGRVRSCALYSLTISKIEKNVSIDHTRNCIQTSNKKKNTCSYTFNIQSYTSTYFHIVGGTSSYTTSTTNMYNKYRFHVLKPALEVCFVVLKNREQRKGEKCEWVGLGWA
jgi:hypothetical protein